ncbi:MAG TPA: hypothetical protein DHM42_00525, partial [Clostridiales bacterium]|nr:hypothetical protein [Clostridiales bacterium]
MTNKVINSKISKLLAILMVFMTVFSYLPVGISPISKNVEATTEPGIESHLTKTVNYYENNASELNDWETICALAGAGIDITDTSKWTLPEWDTKTVPEGSTATKYASRILALIAMDKNPETIWGRNLIQELADKQDEETGSFGTVFDHVFSMHALDTAGASYNNIEALNWLLEQQDTNLGGFGYSEGTSDPDVTGMVLRVLGNYSGINNVNDTIDLAISYLKSIQTSTGGFESYGSENSNTIAVIISGLTSVGEDVESSFWTVDGNTILDALFQFELDDYSYTWLLDDPKTNGLSTAQSLEALGDVLAGNSVFNRLDYDTDTISVDIRIEGISETIYNNAINFKILNESSPTVAEVLTYALEEAGIDYLISDGAYGLFLESIDGEASGTFGGYDGWMYQLNSQSGMGIGADTLVEGDELLFYYGNMAP